MKKLYLFFLLCVSYVGYAQCDVTFSSADYICQSNTVGSGNDEVIIQIPFSCPDTDILSVGNSNITVTPASASVVIQVDTPIFPAPHTGIIELTGSSLIEGVAWSFTINSPANCSGKGSSGTIPSNACDTPVALGSIIINEIMQDPTAVNDEFGEWFEVYNTTGSAIDMQNWVISDNTTPTAQSFTISSSLIVPANDYAIFIVNGNSLTNGGISHSPQYVYSYPSFTLLNSGSDSIILTSPGGALIDRVDYDDASFPYTPGRSMSLSTSTANSTDNDNGANWGNAWDTYGDGDFGTPGAANDFTLSTTIVEIEGFKLYPNPVSYGSFEISTRNNSYKQVSILNSIGITVFEGEIAPYDEVDVSNLLPGIYFVRITENGKAAVKKLIIE